MTVNIVVKLVELKFPTYSADTKDGLAGQPEIDRLNPDPEFKTRPLIGLNMLEDFGYSGGNVWKGGTIYDPDNGKRYKCKLTLTDPNHLEVRGFIGFSFIGRTEGILARPAGGEESNCASQGKLYYRRNMLRINSMKNLT